MKASMVGVCEHKDVSRWDCYHGPCEVVRVFRDGSYLLRNRHNYVKRVVHPRREE